MEEAAVKHALRMLMFACAMFVVAVPKSAAQSVSIQAEMLKDWTGLKEAMNKIANEMPADKFDFKPTPAQQSYGERVLHIAQVNDRFLGMVGGKATAPTATAGA